MKSNWTLWYDSLPAHTKEYLKSQPIWHSKDMAIACGVTFVLGMALGSFITWM